MKYSDFFDSYFAPDAQVLQFSALGRGKPDFQAFVSWLKRREKILAAKRATAERKYKNGSVVVTYGLLKKARANPPPPSVYPRLWYRLPRDRPLVLIKEQ